MTQYIPLTPAASQVCTVTLGGQQCAVHVEQKRSGGVYLSLSVGGVSVLNSRLCRDRVSLVRGQYLPFSGTLVFIDTQGASDPDYGGFGARYKLAYIP